jgi:hypothetical protein
MVVYRSEDAMQTGIASGQEVKSTRTSNQSVRENPSSAGDPQTAPPIKKKKIAFAKGCYRKRSRPNQKNRTTLAVSGSLSKTSAAPRVGGAPRCLPLPRVQMLAPWDLEFLGAEFTHSARGIA